MTRGNDHLMAGGERRVAALRTALAVAPDDTGLRRLLADSLVLAA